MWADYADHGKRFAIAFDRAMLLSAAEEGRRYALFPMLYDRKVQISGTEQIVDHAIQLQRRLNLSSHDIEQFWLEEVAFSLMVCGSRFKHNKWQLEHEFRIAVQGGDDITPFTAAGRPRVAVPFDRNAVVRIVRGRRAAADLKPAQIRERLKRAGYRDDLPILNAST